MRLCLHDDGQPQVVLSQSLPKRLIWGPLAICSTTAPFCRAVPCITKQGAPAESYTRWYKQSHSSAKSATTTKCGEIAFSCET